MDIGTAIAKLKNMYTSDELFMHGRRKEVEIAMEALKKQIKVAPDPGGYCPRCGHKILLQRQEYCAYCGQAFGRANDSNKNNNRFDRFIRNR